MTPFTQSINAFVIGIFPVQRAIPTHSILLVLQIAGKLREFTASNHKAPAHHSCVPFFNKEVIHPLDDQLSETFALINF